MMGGTAMKSSRSLKSGKMSSAKVSSVEMVLPVVVFRNEPLQSPNRLHKLLRNHVSRWSTQRQPRHRCCADQFYHPDFPEVTFHVIIPKLPLISWQYGRRIQEFRGCRNGTAVSRW